MTVEKPKATKLVNFAQTPSLASQEALLAPLRAHFYLRLKLYSSSAESSSLVLLEALFQLR